VHEMSQLCIADSVRELHERHLRASTTRQLVGA